jgi:hypothetical protein
MTHHYTIEIIETKTVLKITYRDSKFKKLEHVRGKLSSNMMEQIGRILPNKETDIPSFNVQHEGKVNYEIVSQEQSLFSKFTSEWFQHNNRKNGFDPKFTGADAGALKQVITYLTKVNEGNESLALDLWIVILDKQPLLTQFFQDNFDLKLINSKLNVIIRQIKQQTDANATSAGGTAAL